MTKRTRVLSASLALVLLGGVLTGCATDEAAKPGGGASSSASTSAVSSTTSRATSGSKSATASTSTSATASSTSASPSSAAVSPTIATPTPTWSPLSAEEQAKTTASLAAIGFSVEFSDPSTFPKKQLPPPNPMMPAEGLKNTELGSKIAVGFYIDSLYVVANGGDNKTLKQVSGNQCINCIDLIKNFETIANEGGFPVSPRTDVYDISIKDRGADGSLTWDATVIYKPYVVYYPKIGAKVVSPDQGGKWSFKTRWLATGRWIVEGAGPK